MSREERTLFHEGPMEMVLVATGLGLARCEKGGVHWVRISVSFSGSESAFHSVGRVVMVVVGNMAWGL